MQKLTVFGITNCLNMIYFFITLKICRKLTLTMHNVDMHDFYQYIYSHFFLFMFIFFPIYYFVSVLPQQEKFSVHLQQYQQSSIYNTFQDSAKYMEKILLNRQLIDHFVFYKKADLNKQYTNFNIHVYNKNMQTYTGTHI